MISGGRIKLFTLLVILLLTLYGCAPAQEQTFPQAPAVPADTASPEPTPASQQPTTVVISPPTPVLPTLTIIVIIPAPTATNPVLTQESSNANNSPPPANPGDQGALVLPTPNSATPEKPPFDRFVELVKNGNSNQIVGVYVENVLALRVVQQPPSNPAFVSNIMGTATQFLLAYTVAGNIGLLAHNYLSGGLFFQLKPGDVVQLIYGDGAVWEYEVGEIQEYQALNPNSPTSDFLNLATGETLSANDLFNRIYIGQHHLAFQTCIQRDNLDTWGRLFVIAPPYQ
jgi:hypothetical protein